MAFPSTPILPQSSVRRKRVTAIVVADRIGPIHNFFD
jgi:hypothetical protein